MPIAAAEDVYAGEAHIQYSTRASAEILAGRPVHMTFRRTTLRSTRVRVRCSIFPAGVGYPSRLRGRQRLKRTSTCWRLTALGRTWNICGVVNVFNPRVV
jgi:hypothetical protein